MDLLQRHRTSLFNSFSKEFFEIDRELRAEFARRDEETAHHRELLRAELEQCRTKACRVDDLEKENRILREELVKALTNRSVAADQSKARPAGGQVGDSRSGQTPAPTLSEGVVHEPVVITREQYNELMAKYKHLNKRYVDVKHAHQMLITKSRKDRENVKAWMQYLEQHQVRLKGSGSTTGTGDRPPILGEAESKEQDREDLLVSATVSLQKQPFDSSLTGTEGQKSDKSVDTRPQEKSNSQEESRRAIDVLRDGSSASGLTRSLRSPESTQDEVDDIDRLPEEARPDPPKIETAESESDLPVVISERSLKRKRPTKPDADAQGNHGPQRGTVKDPIKVKSEHGSSSPIGLSTVQELPNESLDLDEVGWKVRTPRKRARLQELEMFNQQLSPRELSANGNKTQEGSLVGSSPLDENSPPDLPVDEDDMHGEEIRPMVALYTPKGITARNSTASRTTEGPQKAEASNLQSNLLERLALSRSIIDGLHDAGKHQNATAQSLALKSVDRTDRGNLHSRSSSEPADAGASQRLLFQNGKGESRPKKMLEPKSNNMRVLHRSGIRTSGNQGPLHKTLKYGFAKIALMAEDGDPVTHVTPTSRPSSSGPGTDMTITPEQGRSVRNKGEVQQRLGKLLERPTPSKQALRPGQTEAEGMSRSRKKVVEGGPADPPRVDDTWAPRALRGRPLHLLKAEDFRVNPNYNQGVNYAFTETVRNHERRRCLPGCTQPECCGNVFRKSIEIAGLPAPRASELRWNSSPPQNEEDTLLEEFLGDDRDRIKTLTDGERQELLLQARTKQFADKHGKHRQAYERRKTPPGFWRTDMPTTQEIEADREQARKMEQTKVEERYREAMRPGGRWLFRDE